MPGTVRVAFNIKLTDGTPPDVNNLGRAVVKQIVVKFDGKEIYTIDDADLYLCFQDLWMTDKARTNSSYQGIQKANTARIRIGADNADVATQRTRASPLRMGTGSVYLWILNYSSTICLFIQLALKMSSASISDSMNMGKSLSAPTRLRLTRSAI